MHPLQLQSVEARVLGVLIEKERTTPDGYPLSLNALVNGCNQKSNRDPAMSVGEREVNQAILTLRVAGLAEFVQQAGARVEKYRHKAGSALHIEADETAVLAELLLRGPQQPGALRSRVARMHPMATLEDLQAVLDRLAAKGLVVQRERRHGERAARWDQLLAPEGTAASGEAPPGATLPGAVPHGACAPTPSHIPRADGALPPDGSGPPMPGASRGTDLEARVERLEAEVAALRARLGQADRPT